MAQIDIRLSTTPFRCQLQFGQAIPRGLYLTDPMMLAVLENCLRFATLNLSGYPRVEIDYAVYKLRDFCLQAMAEDVKIIYLKIEDTDCNNAIYFA